MSKPLAGISHEAAAASAEARASELVGRVLADRYRVDRLAAVGGMAAIYRGEHVHTRKDVAIKVLHPETEGFPELVARFEREAIAGSRINHPNVVAVIDFGRFDKGAFFLVLEYLEGTTLRDVMREGPVEPLRAARIVRQLAAALGAAHQKGIIHRDVKPRNVMILPERPLGIEEYTDEVPPGSRPGQGDFVKLIDFGFAKVPVELLQLGSDDDFSSRKSLTEAGVVFGTIAYMAPEAALGMRSLGPRADLYAVGIILYEMLAGKHPFEATEANALFLQQRTAIPPPIAIRAPEVRVPPELEAIARRLLEKDPDDRFEDAFMLIAALDAVIETMRGRARRSELPPLRAAKAWAPQLLGRTSKPEARRTSKVPIVLGLLSVATAIGGVAFVARGLSDPKRVSIAATPAESAAAVTSATAPVVTTPPSGLRAELVHAAEDGDGARGGRALLALATSEPTAFADQNVREAAAAIAANLGANGGDTANQVFDALAHKLGRDGPEILYQVGHAGQSVAAARAFEILRRKEMVPRMTPALRIAVELEQVPCDQKSALFPRAARDGDARALATLEKLHSNDCNPKAGECCFRHDGMLERALGDIKARSEAPKR